jgi:1-acyl-sn-glycerol-3-phosphate acyltransferase
MLWLRSVLFNAIFYLFLIAAMIFLCPALLLGPRAVKGVARLWGRGSLWLLRVMCGIGVEFRGLENIPRGSCIVASKHQSFWEVFALITVFPDFSFVLKRELMWIPVFGWYLARAGMIAIDRSKGRNALAKIVRQARGLVAEGGQVFIFPEGTRRRPGSPPAYKFGVAYIYADLGVPCVPVALNSGLFWPRRSFLRRPGTVVVEILPVIQPGLSGPDFLPVLEQRIEAASDRLVAEALAKDPSLGVVVSPALAATSTTG